MIKNVLEKVFEDEYTHFKYYIRSRFNTINEYDAEDIIQQTVLKLLSKGNDTLGIKNISAYMYTSIRNGAIDHIRKRKYEIVNIDDIEIVDDTTVEMHVLLDELKTVIKSAIDSLDEKSRYIFIETELKGRSYSALSRETGTKLGTLLSRKSRTVKKLRDTIESYLQGSTI